MGTSADIAWVRKEKNPVLSVREKDGVVWLAYPALAGIEGIVHGFSTRLGGVSEGHLSSMNLSFSRGDREENVRENFRRISAAIGFDPENLVFSDQTHTANVRVVTREDRGKGFARPRDYTDVDGLVTNVPGLVLATFFADCVPLYFVDPVKRVVGLSHSGWRGTVQKIGRATVERMQSEFGCRPETIIAAIGPSICRDCYEVSGDVADAFAESFSGGEVGRLFYQKENGRYQLDLWAANRLILKEAGILPEHISVTDICTCCNPNLLFSHRASKGRRGNLAAFLGLTF